MFNAIQRVIESEEKGKKSCKQEPPEGGWGWVIVVAYALQNIILLPTLIHFGLMFRDVFESLHMSTTDSSIIINVNSSAGLLFGLMNSALLKMYGFRKIGCVGALLTFIGVSLTSFATNFTEFLIYYGIISSIGVALVMSSFSLALNTYFVEKRGIATGIAMSCTGLGPVFMPLLISKLMTMYSGRGTALIMAALTLHSFAGSLLLQPVKWHYRNAEPVKHSQEMDTIKSNEATVAGEAEIIQVDQSEENNSDHKINEKIDHDSLSNDNLRPSNIKLGSISSLHSDHVILSDEGNRVRGESVDELDGKIIKRHEHGKIANGEQRLYDNCVSNIIEKEALLKSKDYHEIQIVTADVSKQAETDKNKSWKTAVVDIFDLDLLKEPVFRNIWIGMSIEYTSLMNFTLMTPFILRDMGYSNHSTAKVMSIIGTADILTRFICPFIGRRSKLPTRFLYIISLIIMIIFRFGLTVVKSEFSAISVFIGLGISRGFRSIYQSLVMPNYVPLEKLPSASGLQTVLNGICLLSFGPVLGYVRDRLGNYDYYIHLLNVLTLFTIISWTVEFVIRACRYKYRNKTNLN